MTEPERRGPSSHFAEDGRPKRGYSSKRDAKAAARRLLAMFDTHQYAYRCGGGDGCAGWHLSKSPKRQEDA